MKSNAVFVYGSLKRGGAIDITDFGDSVEFVSETATKKSSFNMVDLGSYPGVVQGNSKIMGELWNVTDDVLDTLDMIEGVPSLYRREVVETDDGYAFMYIFNRPVDQSKTSKKITDVSGKLLWNQLI